jgi:hypothetical protein
MSQYSLKPLDDAVASFQLMAGGLPIGEIRREDVHAESLHLGERRYWLLHDESAGGATLLARWLGRLRLNRTYVLRDGDAELARARRHWKAFGRRDWLEYRASGDAQGIRIEAAGMLAGDIRLYRGEAEVGTMAIGGTFRDHISLQLDGFEPASAALLMLAVLRAWGNDPHVRHY